MPFGVGAIIDFEREALMSAGLDAWPDITFPLYDSRLAARLRVEHFLQPPITEGNKAAKLPFVRFPYWHFCPRCRVLKQVNSGRASTTRCDNIDISPSWRNKQGNLYQEGKKTCGKLPQGRRPFLVPVRFVVACEEGHIEDFPWESWAHSLGEDGLKDANICSEPKVYFYATTAGGLAGLRVHCSSCGKVRPMLGATTSKGVKGLSCSGRRPWLGPNTQEPCVSREPARVLQRGASNVYFGSVVSSLLIPPFSKAVRARIDDPKIWETLSAQADAGEIPESFIRSTAALLKLDGHQLLTAVRLKEKGEGLPSEAQTEEEYRYAEYLALSRQNQSLDDHLATVPQTMGYYSTLLQGVLEQVVLVESVAETRALVGFSRIKPRTAISELAALSVVKKNWLPACRVMGEGIFLRVKPSALEQWRRSLGGGLDQLMARASNDSRCSLEITPELVALHTFAHLMINALSFEAGYSSSSIRERLYFGVEGSDTPMSGILLYTAAGDSEGTMGGLVRLGKKGELERVMGRALESARWCSADPICRESKGQGMDSTNLAACHACALLPETSCELGNRWLDRLCVVGSGEDIDGHLERPGFLSGLLEVD